MLGYQYHGEMGAGILGQMYNSKFAEFFSPTQWEEICRAVCCHMCSYHEIDSSSSNAQFKWSLASSECSEVKAMLPIMSIGDHFGAIAEETKSEVDDFLESRKQYSATLNMEFDATKFMTTHSLSGIVIFVRGMSGSGKSYFCEKLVSFLTESEVSYTVVSRDEIICNIALNFIDGVDIATSRVSSRIIGSEYSRLREICMSHSHLKKAIQNEFQTKIIKNLSENKVVIIDTVQSYFEDINFSIPDLSSCLVFAVDIVRNVIMTSHDAIKNGGELDKQIEMHGSRTMFQWLPSNIKFKDIATLTSMRDPKNNRFKARSHITHVISWNDEFTIGADLFFQHLKNFLKTDIVPSIMH